jgi:hypothetical protein
MGPTSASVIPYTNVRIALATAILGSHGATFWWIGWLALATTFAPVGWGLRYYTLGCNIRS